MFNPSHYPRGMSFPHGRAGYTDCDDFGGNGYVARNTWTGCLDATDYIPQGSIKGIGMSGNHPEATLAHRDGKDRPPGSPHDL